MRRRGALALAVLLASLVPASPASAVGSPPYASVTWSCGENATCLFDGRASWDPEETPLTYAWRVLQPDPDCGPVEAAGETAWLCIGPQPREVELWVADADGLTDRWNLTVSAQGFLVGLRPNPCQGLRCDFTFDVSAPTYVHLTINTTGKAEPFCWVDSSGGDAWGGPECWHHAVLPGNGTYAVQVRADDQLGNVTDFFFEVAVANRAPKLSIWMDCRDGSLRCGGWAHAYDEDDWNWSLNVTWEPEPGIFVQGSQLDWLFSRPGIHRVRARTEDAHGWVVAEREILSLRNHAWSQGPGLPPGHSPALASDGGTLYVLDALPSATASTRIQRLAPSTADVPRSLKTVNLKVAEPAFVSTWSDLHVLGGDSGTGPVDFHQILDVHADAWRTGPALPVPLAGATAVFDHSHLWLLGGRSPQGPSSATWRLVEGAWVPGPDLPWNGTVRGTFLYGAVYVAGERNGVAEIFRYRPAGELAEGWEPLPLPDGGLGKVRGLAAFDRRVWVVAEGAPWTVRAFDPFPVFGANAAWDAPLAAPEPLGAVVWSWDSLWAVGRDVRTDGTRAVHVLGPVRVPFTLRMALPAVVYEHEAGRLLARAEAAAGTPFEELLALTLHRAGDESFLREDHLTLMPGTERVDHGLPALPPGRYRASVYAYASGHSLHAPFEVVTVWG